jgi:aspartoacylase
MGEVFSIMENTLLIEKLDKVADELQNRGLYRLASDIDQVSNTLMKVSPDLGLVDIPKDDLIKTVLFSGGTQGDEMTGITLMGEIAKNPTIASRPGVDLKLQLSNPAAIERCVHFIDEDLNDCFSMEDLTNPNQTKYEMKLAQSIFQNLGGKKGNVDLIVDFHNTTCNMGITLIVSRLSPFMCKLVATLTHMYPDDLKILYTPEVQETSPYLDSLGKNGLTVEVGPLKHGPYLNKVSYAKTKRLASDIMDFVVNWNSGNIPKKGITVPVYRQVQTIEYMVDKTNMTRISDINPELLGKDYSPINKGEILQYMLGTGEPIRYEGTETVYPVFIEEAAKSYRDPKYGDEAMDLTWLSHETW